VIFNWGFINIPNPINAINDNYDFNDLNDINAINDPIICTEKSFFEGPARQTAGGSEGLSAPEPVEGERARTLGHAG
jgi:hypothetical protein